MKTKEAFESIHRGKLDGSPLVMVGGFELGEQIQCVENNWQGRVAGFEMIDGVAMLICHHVCGDEIELDDKQWFDPRDVRLVKTSFDLGLSDNDRVLHASLSTILARENSILDPDDSECLALVIVNEMPPVYNAAPDLLSACEKVLASIEYNIAHDALPETRECLRAAIAKAKGTTA